VNPLIPETRLRLKPFLGCVELIVGAPARATLQESEQKIGHSRKCPASRRYSTGKSVDSNSVRAIIRERFTWFTFGGFRDESGTVLRFSAGVRINKDPLSC
jgi:hypothetical protein